MTLYAVIDTNVLVSALLSKHSDAATVILVSKMISGEFIPVYNTDIMKEYQEVLNRKKFRFDPDRIAYLLSAINQFGLMVEPCPTGEVLPDMKDLPFYEVVIEKRRKDEAYLVTGNQQHFPVQPFIVTAREMLEIMKS